MEMGRENEDNPTRAQKISYKEERDTQPHFTYTFKAFTEKSCCFIRCFKKIKSSNNEKNQIIRLYGVRERKGRKVDSSPPSLHFLLFAVYILC